MSVFIDSNHNEVDTTITWSVDPPSLGYFQNPESGLFFANQEGRGRIMAQVGDYMDETNVHVKPVEVDENDGNRLIISPSDTTVEIGSQIQFTVKYRIRGQLYRDTIAEWSLEGDSIGTISQDGQLDVLFEDSSLVGIRFLVMVGDSVAEPYYFNAPLTVAIPFKRDLLDSLGIDPADLGLFFMDDEGVYDGVGIESIIVDSVANKIYAEHFSSNKIIQTHSIR